MLAGYYCKFHVVPHLKSDLPIPSDLALVVARLDEADQLSLMPWSRASSQVILRHCEVSRPGEPEYRQLLKAGEMTSKRR